MPSRRSPWAGHAPLALLVLSPLAAVAAAVLLPPPAGHWSDHLRWAAAAGGCVVAVAVGAWLVRDRLSAAPLLILGALTTGLALRVVGSAMVARTIWRQPGGADVIPARAGSLSAFERGHDLAGWADNLILVSGLALAVYAGARLWVTTGPAFLGGVLAFVPPRVLPGAGAVFLLAWTAVHRRRRPAGAARTPAGPGAAPAESGTTAAGPGTAPPGPGQG